MPTKNELKYYQSMSLEDKIEKTRQAIETWVREFQKYTVRNWYTGAERTIISNDEDIWSKITKDEDVVEKEPAVYVSFSGGKDSTVLLHIVRQMYPEIEAVFVNTGLEYPEIQSFVKTFDNVTILRPKMRFDEVIKKHGYPFIGKTVAHNVSILRNCPNGKVAKNVFDPNKKGKYAMHKWTPLLISIQPKWCELIASGKKTIEVRFGDD